jgi:hypothetical protein
MSNEKLLTMIENIDESERSLFYATMRAIALCFHEKEKYGFVLLMRHQVDKNHYVLSVAAKNTDGLDDTLKMMNAARDQIYEGAVADAPERSMYN